MWDEKVQIGKDRMSEITVWAAERWTTVGRKKHDFTFLPLLSPFFSDDVKSCSSPQTFNGPSFLYLSFTFFSRNFQSLVPKRLHSTYLSRCSAPTGQRRGWCSMITLSLQMSACFLLLFLLQDFSLSCSFCVSDTRMRDLSVPLLELEFLSFFLPFFGRWWWWDCKESEKRPKSNCRLLNCTLFLRTFSSRNNNLGVLCLFSSHSCWRKNAQQR